MWVNKECLPAVKLSAKKLLFLVSHLKLSPKKYRAQSRYFFNLSFPRKRQVNHINPKPRRYFKKPPRVRGLSPRGPARLRFSGFFEYKKTGKAPSVTPPLACALA